MALPAGMARAPLSLVRLSIGGAVPLTWLGKFNDEGLVPSIDGLDAKEVLAIRDWVQFYEKDYKPLGRLIGAISIALTHCGLFAQAIIMTATDDLLINGKNMTDW